VVFISLEALFLHRPVGFPKVADCPKLKKRKVQYSINFSIKAIKAIKAVTPHGYTFA
jgi:predicted transcriptional regulator